MLEHLEGDNLFLFSMDDQRYWYRYHQLFAELLKERLSQIDPASIPALRQRAIRWHEENGLIPMAIEQAFLVKDYARAASLISKIVEELWGRGEHITLLEWMNSLPEEVRRNYPQL